jgi:phage terminase large subunit GpA-like protein
MRAGQDLREDAGQIGLAPGRSRRSAASRTPGLPAAKNTLLRLVHALCLLRHSQLKLNATLVAAHEHAWTERDVRRWGEELVDRIAAIWPRPAHAAGGEDLRRMLGRVRM